VLARKGVLISDPSVHDMTHAQWLWEAQNLAKKERLELDRVADFTRVMFQQTALVAREIIIHLFGLHLAAPDRKPEDESTPYLPLVVYASHPEMFSELMKRKKEMGTEADVTAPEVTDLVERVKDITMADLEPLFTGAASSDPLERWNSAENQAYLKALGIDVSGVETKADSDNDASDTSNDTAIDAYGEEEDE